MANVKQLAIFKKGVTVWNAWRLEQPFELIDLSGADLQLANFSGADLRGANLRQVKFRGAELKYSKFRGADLSDTDFSGANLRGADLSEVDFTGANLKGADLQQAKLIVAILLGADLSGADLSGALFADTIFANTNLSSVVGLDKSRHYGPSSVDHRTLERSGSVSIFFLRGCGLPEPLIDYLPSLLVRPISFYSCFISYSHADKVFARRLHDQLQGRGVRCWLDEHQLLPGDDIYDQVEQGIKMWDKVLLCASKNALTSWWVDSEIDAAFVKEQQLMKQRGRKVWSLIPLNLDGYLFSGKWARGMAGQVQSRLAADFTGWETDNDIFEQAFEHVVGALKTDDLGRESAPEPKL